MNPTRFDRLSKRFAARGLSRRQTLRGLGVAGLAGAFGTAGAAKKDRRRKRESGKENRGKARVSAQAADCLSPGHGSDISGCPYQGEDFSGQDLSSSRMVGTNFRGALLAGTDLSSSNAKNAVFREADLTCADLRSSTLGGADFRDADLTLAKLKSSSGCSSATFTAGTTFSGTVMCDGSVRNDDSPPGFDPTDACCTDADCPSGQTCAGGICASCPEGMVELGNGSCALLCGSHAPCQERGGLGCRCVLPLGAPPVCARLDNLRPCTEAAGCFPGEACHAGRCQSLCGLTAS